MQIYIFSVSLYSSAAAKETELGFLRIGPTTSIMSVQPARVNSMPPPVGSKAVGVSNEAKLLDHAVANNFSKLMEGDLYDGELNGKSI